MKVPFTAGTGGAAAVLFCLLSSRPQYPNVGGKILSPVRAWLSVILGEQPSLLLVNIDLLSC